MIGDSPDCRGFPARGPGFLVCSFCFSSCERGCAPNWTGRRGVIYFLTGPRNSTTCTEARGPTRAGGWTTSAASDGRFTEALGRLGRTCAMPSSPTTEKFVESSTLGLPGISGLLFIALPSMLKEDAPVPVRESGRARWVLTSKPVLPISLGLRNNPYRGMKRHHFRGYGTAPPWPR